ncbi:MAG: (Fe-S)-binding protein [Nitrososphaeria archaeon]
MTKQIIESIKEEADACINCGLCDAVCPTLPAFDYQGTRGARGRMIIAKKFSEDLIKKGYTDLFIRDVYYSCLECNACKQACSAGLNPGLLSNMVKQAISAGLIKGQNSALAEAISKNIINHKDPLGLKDQLAEWSKGLKFEDVYDTILFTDHSYQLLAYYKKLGQVGERAELDYQEFQRMTENISKDFDPKIKEKADRILKTIFKLLENAGIKFSYLGKEEPYSGILLLEYGHADEFKKYAQEFVDYLNNKGVKTLIVIDPHTYDVLLNKYPVYTKGFNFKVIYYLDLIKNLGFKKTDTTVTYHEPCYFTRHLEYSLPLQMLSNTSKLIMPLHKGKNTYCCGGPISLLYPEASDNIAQRRLEELKRTKAETIITVCPLCYLNLSKDETVKDISEYLVKLI